MQTSLNGSRRRKGLARSVAALAACALGSLAFACAKDASFVMIGAGEREDGGRAISFVPTDDAGDAGALMPEHLLCAATDCPAPYATCPDQSGSLPAYACGTNLATDSRNCGGCGVLCRGAPNTAYHLNVACVDGECQGLCEQGFLDCNGIIDDGCEVDPQKNRQNCGGCGNKCPDGVACINGSCGCPPGMTLCDLGCTDLSRDDFNCGSCNFWCSEHQPDGGTKPLPPNTFFGCSEGKCEDIHCYHDMSTVFADCDNVRSNGCEVNLSIPNMEHCGRCNNKCDPGQRCTLLEGSTALDCQCKGGKTLCGASCVDLENDPKNCGSCGYGCPTKSGLTATCSHGRCSFECPKGFADCNGNPIDGCEAQLAKDPRNCGACGNSCDVANGQPCIGGTCAMKECDDQPETTK